MVGALSAMRPLFDSERAAGLSYCVVAARSCASARIDVVGGGRPCERLVWSEPASERSTRACSRSESASLLACRVARAYPCISSRRVVCATLGSASRPSPSRPFSPRHASVGCPFPRPPRPPPADITPLGPAYSQPLCRAHPCDRAARHLFRGRHPQALFCSARPRPPLTAPPPFGPSPPKGETLRRESAPTDTAVRSRLVLLCLLPCLRLERSVSAPPATRFSRDFSEAPTSLFLPPRLVIKQPFCSSLDRPPFFSCRSPFCNVAHGAARTTAERSCESAALLCAIPRCAHFPARLCTTTRLLARRRVFARPLDGASLCPCPLDRAHLQTPLARSLGVQAAFATFGRGGGESANEGGHGYVAGGQRAEGVAARGEAGHARHREKRLARGEAQTEDQRMGRDAAPRPNAFNPPRPRRPSVTKSEGAGPGQSVRALGRRHDQRGAHRGRAAAWEKRVQRQRKECAGRCARKGRAGRPRTHEAPRSRGATGTRAETGGWTRRKRCRRTDGGEEERKRSRRRKIRGWTRTRAGKPQAAAADERRATRREAREKKTE